jgi:hypothetical protein
MAQDKFQWWTFVNAVMNLQFLKSRELFGLLSRYKHFKKDPVSWS